MNQIEFKALLEKYINGNCSPDEIVLLESWYLSESKEKKIPSASMEELQLYKKVIWGGIQQNTAISQKLTIKKSDRLWPKILVAASLILILSFGGYYLQRQYLKQETSQNANAQKDVLPGSDKAVLVLSNGQQISLGSAQSGLIAKEGNALIKKDDLNVISYKEIPDQANDQELAYNTVKTPNGGQWPAIELPDGTKVFLDAASSISFPVSFNNERKVAVTGQVYFQVVHNSKKPFRVTVKGLTIEDMGTDFNVNAYDDEPTVKTTLIEGIVSVARKNQKLILKPGQQAVTTEGTNNIFAKEVDLEQVTAWKKGLFQFERTGIEAVMRQIARWYNVEIIYKDDVSKLSFTGNLPRNLKLSRLLEMLSITGLHFKIEDKKIIITP